MATYIELYVDQGATFNRVINLKDDVTNTPINIAGYTVTSQIRRSYYSTNVSANILCTLSNTVNGEITMTMTAANTANIKAGRYVYDVKAVTPSNTTSRVIEGIITVTPQVTK